MKTQMVQDLGGVQVVANDTEGSLRNLTSVEKFRIMGHIVSEEMSRSANSLINVGKQAQWVGRQLIVGLTLPLVIAGQRSIETFLKLNRAQTELSKYLQQTGLSFSQVATLVNDKLAPAFANIAKQTGLYADEVTNLAAAWVAAGTAASDIQPFVELTAQLQMVGQGEIDMASSMELVRSVSRTFGLDVQDTTSEVQKLALVAGETALTLNEITTALPLASTAASGLGLTASELAVALGAMREQGVQANAAANTLKFSINRLVNPTQTAIDKFKELTGQNLEPLIFTPQGEGRGIEALENLAKVFDDTSKKVLSSQQKLQLAGQLFGGYRADKMLKLIQSINDEGSTYSKVLGDISNQEKALSVWENQLNTIRQSAAFQWQQLRVQFSLVVAQVGKELVPIALQVGQVIVDFLNKFSNASDATKKFVVAMAAVAASIGPVTYVLGQLGLSVGSLFKAMVAFPLKAVFGLKSAELPMARLAELATKTKNPILQAAAGLPVITEQLVQSSEEYTVAIGSWSIALGKYNTMLAETLVLQENLLRAAGETAAANELAAQRQFFGAPNLPNVLRSPRAGVPGGAIIDLKSQLAGLDEYDNVVNEAFAELADDADDAARAAKLAAQNQLADMFRIPGNLRQTYGNDLELLLLDVTDDVSHQLTVRRASLASQILGFEKLAAERGRTAGTLAKFLETVGKDASPAALGISDDIAITMAAGLAPALEQQTGGVVSTIKGWLTGVKNNLTVVAPGSGGGFSLFSLAFGNPAKILLGVGAVAVAIQHLPDLMKGWSDEQAQAGNIITASFSKIKDQFTDFVSGTDGASSSFVALGDAVGGLVVSLTKAGAVIAETMVPTLAFLADVTSRTIASIIEFFTLDWEGMAKSIIGPAGEATTAIGQLKLAIVLLGTALVASKVGIFFLEIGDAIKTFALSLSAARATMALETAATSGIVARAASGVDSLTFAFKNAIAVAPGWLKIAAIIAYVGVQVISSMYSMRDSTAKFSESMSAAQEDVEKAFVGISEAADGSAAEFETALKQMESAVDSWSQDLAKKLAEIPTLDLGLGVNISNPGDNILTQSDIPFLSGISDAIFGAPVTADEAAAKVRQQNQELTALFKDYYLDIGEMSAERVKQTEDEIAAYVESLRLQMSIAKIGLSSFDAGSEEWQAATVRINGYSQAIRIATQWLNGFHNAVDAGLIPPNTEIFPTSQLDSSLSAIERWAAKIKDTANSASEAFKDEFQSQLSDLMNSAIDATLDAFDAVTERHIQGIQDSADAQVAAIQKQLDAIEEQNQKEEWLQQQREYRQQRQDLLNQKNLDAAIAARQQLIQFAQGNFDEGVLIGMQAREKTRDTGRQVRDLDAQHRQDVEDHQEQQLVDRLQEQQDNIQSAAQAQIDSFQSVRDAERESLQARLDYMAKFVPKNKRQWEMWEKNFEGVLDDFGVSLDDVNTKMLPSFGADLHDGLSKAYDNAKRIVAWESGNLGALAKQHYEDAERGAYDPDDIKLYEDMATFLEEVKSGDMDPGHLANWLRKLSNDMSAASNKAQSNISGLPTPPSGFQAIVARRGYHTGGTVLGQGEVPAKLLSGEYVVRREAVKRLGVDNLDRINNSYKSNRKLQVNEYHQGGMVGGDLAATSALNPYVARFSGMYALARAGKGALSGLVNAIGAGVYSAIQGTYAPTPTFTTPGEYGDAMFIDGVDRIKTPIGYVTPPTYNYWEQANSQFNGLRSMGAWVIKKILGTDSWSQHSYGNAIDIGSSVPTMGKLWEWGLGNRAALRLQNLIYNHQIWNEGGGIHPYTGSNPHTDHVHADFVPSWAGYPGTYSNPSGYPTGGAPPAPPISAQTGTTSGSNTPSETGNVDQRLYSKTPASQKLAQSYGHSMMLQKWNDNQWPSLQELWTRESAWRWWAENTGSGAYGIPQSLPGSKMASAGNDWRTNALTQIKWGLGYIGGRYGNPQSALNHSDQYHWYHSGGMVNKYPGIVTADDGALFKRRQLANVAPNELAIPLDNPNAVSKLVQSLSRVAPKDFSGVTPMNDLKFNNPRRIGSSFSINSNVGGRENLNVQHDNSATINMSINIDQMFGDENSYRRLAETLEKVGNRMARERGAKNISIRYDG